MPDPAPLAVHAPPLTTPPPLPPLPPPPRCAPPLALQVTKYELVGFSSARGLPTVRVQAFEPEVLPLFLEGPVRHMKTLKEKPLSARRAVYAAVRNSTLRDTKLSMYKISESLKGQPFEVGRMMAFNPGWLENESIWMHMSYKWYLEVRDHKAHAHRPADPRSQPEAAPLRRAHPSIPAPLSPPPPPSSCCVRACTTSSSPRSATAWPAS